MSLNEYICKDLLVRINDKIAKEKKSNIHLKNNEITVKETFHTI
jgi:hypothetical protein